MAELVSSNVLTVLSFLFPGFVAAWAYYGLTSFPKPSQFERVIQAFIFTMVVQVVVYAGECAASVVRGNTCLLTDLPENGRIALSVVAAFVVGSGFAFMANNDEFHRIMRRLHLTKETSYPSEWYSTFTSLKMYVVLHLDGQRRLYGWPMEWPSDPEKGHFSMVEAEWLSDDPDKDSIVLAGVERLLVPVSEVSLVEFMKPTVEESDNG